MTSPPPVTGAGAPRPPRRPRLLALDLDGTVLDLEQRCHPRTRAAVAGAVGAGLVVVLATGRMYRSALPWAQDLGVLAPLVCYQGAMVRGIPEPGAPVRDGVPQGAVLYEDPLEPDCALVSLEVARRAGWHRQAYHDDVLYCEEDRPEGRMYARIAQVDVRLVEDLAPIMAAGTTKAVCVVDDAGEAARCEAGLREALGEGARVVRSLPQFVEVTSPTAGKARALMHLCERLDVEPEEVVAVGDAPNDADMLTLAGYAVAVAGAPEAVLAAADAVCARPQDAGVADVVEALGLAG